MAPRRPPPAWAQKKTEMEQSTDGVPEAFLWQARKTGALRLVGRNLKGVPPSVYNIYEMKKETSGLESMEDRWWECEPITRLDLSSNFLTEIEEDIEKLGDLVDLDVRHNELVTLPQALWKLSRLATLEAAHNLLSSFDLLPSVNAFPLVTLNLSHNKLKSLPEDIGLFASLQTLNLSHNEIVALPASIGTLKSLTYLDVSYNSLSAMPDNAAGLVKLATFMANHNQIQSLNQSWSSLPSLELFIVNANQICAMPEMSCVQLKELCLADNAIAEISKGTLAKLAQLTLLDLGSNKLTEVPEDCLLLPSLERLILSNNDITNLPPQLSLLPNLKLMAVEGNAIRSIRRDVLAGGTVRLLKYLETRLPAPSATDSQQPSSESLAPKGPAGRKTIEFMEKNAAEIPEHLFSGDDCDSVRKVVLSDNLLKTLPESLLTLSMVEILDCHGNQLASLPPLYHLAHLSILDLSRNSLENFDFPVSESEDAVIFPSLTQLALSNNRLHQCPSILPHCPMLTSVLLDNNSIEEVDPELCRRMAKMENLRVLDLTNNDVSRVPPELGLCKQLNSLRLAGNTFRVPNQAVLSKGTAATLDWLHMKLPL